METQVIDGKVEIENGNVPEDKATNVEESDTISPFHIPSMRLMCSVNETFRLDWLKVKYGTIPVMS